MKEIFAAVLTSGVISAVIAGGFSYWQNTRIEKLKAQWAKDAEILKAQLALKASAYEKEYEIYKDLWNAFFPLWRKIRFAKSDVENQKFDEETGIATVLPQKYEIKFEEFSDELTAIALALDRHRPFFDDTVYQKLDKFSERAVSRLVAWRFEALATLGKNELPELEDEIKEILDAIRKRIVVAEFG